MRGRDPGEEHRASTPLELLFDLCFVVAVAQAAAELHHALTEGHLGAGLAGYVAVFFAIWWAWMNFTWFASAYDTDDAPYRLLTLLQMAGVLVLAAGVPRAFEHYDFSVVVAGYVLMRIGLVAQWLRAAAGHPGGRPAALRYAGGILVVQIGWIARLWAPGVWGWVTFVVLAIAEMAIPAWAEFRGRETAWHPGHIAERYGLFTIIVLGEVILATLTAVQSALTESGVSAPLVLVALGALVLVFALWWIYFTGAEAHLRTQRIALTWGYGHYLVFAAVAALGAGLEVAVDAVEHKAHVSEQAAALAVAVPVAVVMVVLAALHRLTGTGAVARTAIVAAGVVLVLLLAFSPPLLGLGGAVAGIAVVVAATLTVNLVVLSTSDRPR
ncbi:low temperature requirement protein A [Amycolatopsis sp. K13G38]|uniref:Low temperature requirement protein A n=2 Tax=Amycolatopsis acididurans TaxID=2724524 RepID=A0ABX1IVC8_9PSEU|nr:low temperature requirement protein A [Amycolatopsis acididurans]